MGKSLKGEIVWLIVLFGVVVVIFFDSINPMTPIYAYPDNDQIIGKATTLEQAMQFCDDYYSQPNSPFPTGATAQIRWEIPQYKGGPAGKNLGFECLPVLG